MSSNSALTTDSQPTRTRKPATNVNKNQFKPALSQHSNHLQIEVNPDHTFANTNVPQTLSKQQPAILASNMNDSIKEEANDTLTRDELELTHNSDQDEEDDDESSRLTKQPKDIEDGEILDNQDDDDEEEEDGEEEEELSSSDDLPKPKQKTSGSKGLNDQESCGSDDEYVEESDYQSQSPAFENRSNISSDQSESHESP